MNSNRGKILTFKNYRAICANCWADEWAEDGAYMIGTADYAEAVRGFRRGGWRYRGGVWLCSECAKPWPVTQPAAGLASYSKLGEAIYSEAIEDPEARRAREALAELSKPAINVLLKMLDGDLFYSTSKHGPVLRKKLKNQLDRAGFLIQTEHGLHEPMCHYLLDSKAALAWAIRLGLVQE